MEKNKDGAHIKKLFTVTFTPHFLKRLYEKGFIKTNNCNLPFAAKEKDDKVCLWCGGKLKNDNDSFCSFYCASMWYNEEN